MFTKVPGRSCREGAQRKKAEKSIAHLASSIRYRGWIDIYDLERHAAATSLF